MSKYVEGFDVNQLTFFPMSFDDMIDEDNPVRSISAIVDTMDDTVLTFTHSKTKSTGRPPYNPVMIDTKIKVFPMLKLWGYQNEI